MISQPWLHTLKAIARIHYHRIQLPLHTNLKETAVTLAGIVLGVLVAQRAEALHDYATYGLFALLTLLHVYANWRGVCALQLTTINRHRLDILIEHSKGPSDHDARIVAVDRVADMEKQRWGLGHIYRRCDSLRTRDVASVITRNNALTLSLEITY